MSILVSIPVLTIGVILQSTVFSRVTLLEGPADIVLLIIASWSLQENVTDEWVWAVIGGAFVGFVSAMPFWLPILGYLVVMFLAVYLKQRVWQIPLLALVAVVSTGTVIFNLLAYLVLLVFGAPLDFIETINLILLPSLLLNLLLAIPVHGVVGELAKWLFPRDFDS